MKKIFALLTVFCLVFPRLAFAGAWTLPIHQWCIEYYMKANWAKNDFGPDRDLRRFPNPFRPPNNVRSWGWSMIPKAEYGVNDWFSILGSLEYKESKWKEYTRPASWGAYRRKSHGITEFNFGGKLRFLKDPVVLSGQLKAFIYSGKGCNEDPQLSDGNSALELRGLVGKSFDGPIPFYLGAETGYRFKNRNVCNDIPFFIETGFWPLKWFLIKTEIDGYWSHDGTGNLEKEYAIWRIGPTIQLYTLYQLLAGHEIGREDIGGLITKKGRSFNIELQYGNTFWGRNYTAYQEAVVKVSTQF